MITTEDVTELAKLIAPSVCQKSGHIPNRDRSLPGSCDFHRRMAQEYVTALAPGIARLLDVHAGDR